MTSEMKTVVYPVSDIETAKRLYGTLLGVAPAVDQPYYVGFEVGGQHVGLDPNGHRQGMTGATGYWHVDDLHASLRELVASGAAVQQDATDVGGGKLVARVRDADGNLIGLLQDGR